MAIPIACLGNLQSSQKGHGLHLGHKRVATSRIAQANLFSKSRYSGLDGGGLPHIAVCEVLPRLGGLVQRNLSHLQKKKNLRNRIHKAYATEVFHLGLEHLWPLDSQYLRINTSHESAETVVGERGVLLRSNQKSIYHWLFHLS